MNKVETGPLAGYPRNVLEKFKKYHNANPDVWELFKKYAFDMINAGHSHYSSEVIINMIRWHHDIRSSGVAFKINNDFKPIYSRMFAYKFPDHKDFFRFREVKSLGIGSDEERNRLRQNVQQ